MEEVDIKIEVQVFWEQRKLEICRKLVTSVG